jgi:hypothetical protein
VAGTRADKWLEIDLLGLVIPAGRGFVAVPLIDMRTPLAEL